MPITALPINAEVRVLLEKLAGGMFPLANWLTDKDANRFPPPQPQAPWRTQSSPWAPKDLLVIEFLERLIAEDEPDQDLAERWQSLAIDPLGLQTADPTLPGTLEWRADRDLNAEAVLGGSARVLFAAANSNNAIVVEGKSGELQVAGSRDEFYARCWPKLIQAVQAANPTNQSNLDWEAFAKQLCDPTNTFWPAGVPTSPEFMRVLGRDLLTAMLGMQTGLAGDSNVAVQIELMEHRRANVRATFEDAQDAVVALERRVLEISGS